MKAPPIEKYQERWDAKKGSFRRGKTRGNRLKRKGESWKDYVR